MKIEKISTEGVQLVIASVQDPSKMSNGLVVGDDKFILIRSDPGVALILKKGALGVVAYKSSQGKLQNQKEKMFLNAFC